MTDIDAIAKQTTTILKLLKKDLWTAQWASVGYDTQAGKRIVLDSLRQVSLNIGGRRPWNTDVPLIASEHDY